MKRALIILLLLVCFVPFVNAQTITMANPDATAQKDVLVYYTNGTLVGLYNTTSIITLDANYSYIFTLKPQYSNPLDDPITWLNSTFQYLGTNATYLAIAIFLIGLFYFGRR